MVFGKNRKKKESQREKSKTAEYEPRERFEERRGK
jgi:hypothetical protein